MNILFVEQDIENQAGILEFLNQLGHRVIACNNAAEARKLFAMEKYPIVFMDTHMLRVSGIGLLETILAMSEGPETDVILFSVQDDLDLAMTAMRVGATDYLVKPVDTEELTGVIERSLERRKRHTAMERHLCRMKTQDSQIALLADGKAMKCTQCKIELGIFSDRLKKIIEQALKYHSDRQMPVLIEGETGAGKEGIAKIIHCGQTGDHAPFVDVNCAALAPSLFESELFGYEPGSFTGSLTRGQKGKVELAMGGTLFLDEVSEIPLEQQGKLLRLLQEKEFYRVGGTKKVKADVRFVCATNVSLEQKVKEGRFRKDLYYRLKVGYIMIPPLRQRREEILPLANMFLTDCARAKGKRFSSIGETAARVLRGYHWPGNIRELRNIIEWLVLMCDDVELTAEHLKLLNSEEDSFQDDVAAFVPAKDFPDISLPKGRFLLEGFIDYIVCKALAMHHGNRTKTANYLGISRRVLSYRLDRMQCGKSEDMALQK